jgi:predicted cupin superfamily sugar epimerase
MSSSASVVSKSSELIKHYGLLAHPEGCFYKETYRAASAVSVMRDADESSTPKSVQRSASTAIIFLVSGDSVSRLHRIKSDEVWHFYGGSALTVVELDDTLMEVRTTQLGTDLLRGEVVQYVVRANVWFGSFSQGEYSLVGCTVAPGFEFEDLEMANADSLRKKFEENPTALAYIDKLAIGL